MAGAGTETTERMFQNIQMALAAGVDWLQIREKDLPTGQLLEGARFAVNRAANRARNTERPVRIIINDRLDVALAAHADGVHLGRESAPPRAVVRWCRAGNAPDRFVIGVSCHSVEEAREAENAGAEYIFFGPVFETPSKKSFGKPQGIETLAEVCFATRIPVIAIGGVDQKNASSCIRAGSAGVAAIRMFQESREENSLRDAVDCIHDLL